MHPGIEQFRLSEEDAALLQRDFALVATAVDLNRFDPTRYPELRSATGCYLWLMTLTPARYKIYLGKTSSLLRRVSDYGRDFQIHSPNDYKLRFFQDLLALALPSATMDLYFTSVPLTQCTGRETDLVRRFRPLINVQPAPNDEERRIIQDAFRRYYESVTKRALAGGA